MAPRVTVERFTQCCNRLEILRNLTNVPNKLMLRLLRRWEKVELIYRENGKTHVVTLRDLDRVM